MNISQPTAVVLAGAFALGGVIITVLTNSLNNRSNRKQENRRIEDTRIARAEDLKDARIARAEDRNATTARLQMELEAKRDSDLRDKRIAAYTTLITTIHDNEDFHDWDRADALYETLQQQARTAAFLSSTDVGAKALGLVESFYNYRTAVRLDGKKYKDGDLQPGTEASRASANKIVENGEKFRTNLSDFETIAAKEVGVPR